MVGVSFASRFPPQVVEFTREVSARVGAFVSLAIPAGANVKAVQRMLGHASAAMTLDTYADLFEDDLDQAADAMERAREGRNSR